MARCNPCLLLPLPIVACRRSRSAVSTIFATFLFIFFWATLAVGIGECAQGTCTDTLSVWVFAVFFYFLALFAQFDMFDEEYVSYKERRKRFRDAEEQARLLKEQKQKKFKKTYSIRSMIKEADRVAKARRRSTLLGVELPSMDREKLEEEKIRLETGIELARSYGDEEKNALIAIFERDLEKVNRKLDELNKELKKAAFEHRYGVILPSAARGDRVPRFSDVV